MTETYASLWVDELDSRHKEIEKLITLAKEKSETDQESCDAICRSATVMLFAHFEGALKAALKSYSQDLEANGGFGILNERLRSLFLCGMLEIEITNENISKTRDRRQRLEARLDGVSGIKLDFRHLWIGGRNPTADTYKNVIMRFGIDNIYQKIENTEFEDALFSGGLNQVNEKSREASELFRRYYGSFPYDSSEAWKIVGEKKDGNKSKKTITEEFLNNTIKPRHDIAHGEVMGNVMSLEMIEEASIRLKCLSILYYISISLRN